MPNIETKIHYQSVRSCPLCSSKAKRSFPINIESYNFGNVEIPLPTHELKLNQCQFCGLCYKNYIPTQHSLQKLFDKHANNIWITKQYSFSVEIKILYNYIRIGRSKVIDIGSSDGGFIKKISNLFLIKSALDVYNDPQCNLAVNGEYIIDFIEAGNLKSKYQYDVITAFDIFEHFYDPAQALFNCKKLLNTNGVILGETGLTDNIQNPETWWYVKLIEHHIFWNKKSLKYLKNLDFKLDLLCHSAHKGRRYMNPFKRLILLFFHLTSRIKFIKTLIKKITSIDASMIGNPYKKDHAIFVLRSYD